MTTVTIKGIKFEPLYPNADKALAREWVKELRNPERNQARRRLREKDGSMCCLGVLCDIVNPSGWSVDGPDWVFNDGGNQHYGSMPYQLAEKFLGEQSGYAGSIKVAEHGTGSSPARAITAADLNDEFRFTFAQIAQAIEVVFDLL